MQAIILAAGRGKRLHPITSNRSKAMTSILGKPIVARVMDNLIYSGIQEFIVVISPKDEEITAYYEHYYSGHYQVKLVYQNQPLGMGHALLQAVPYIEKDFFLTACDNLMDRNEIKLMLDIWNRENPNAILTTLQVSPSEIIRMGMVELESEFVTRIVEKPNLNESPSNIGSPPIYIFSIGFLDYLSAIELSPRGEYELQDAIQAFINQEGNTRAFQIENRLNLTTPEDLLALNLSFLNTENPQVSKEWREKDSSTTFINPVYLEHGVSIGSNSRIGPNVFLERDCSIGQGVRLENMVVLRGRTVQNHSVIKDKVFS